MRMDVNRRQFIAALDAVRPALDRRRDAPEVLGTMRMRVNGHVAIEATDLDIELTSRIELGDGQRCGEGDFVISQPDALRGALKFMDGDTLTIEGGDDGSMTLRAGKQEIGVRSDKIASDDLPPLVAKGIGSTMRVGTGFELAILRLLPAVSVEETRYYLNGIAIRHLGDWAFRLAATDGHRLHIAQVEIPDATGPFPDGDMIIGRRTLKQLVPMLARANGSAEIAFGHRPPRNSDAAALTEVAPSAGMPSRVQITTADQMLTGKLIDGFYPDYMKVVPDAFASWIEVDRRALIRAVRLAMQAMPGTKTRGVRLTVDAIGDVGVTSTLPAKEYGIEAAVSVASKQTVGLKADDQAGFNGAYLVDALNSFIGETVRFAWPAITSGELSNTPCRVDDPSDDKYFVVLMPMRV